MRVYTGGCHCGRVRFEVTGDLIADRDPRVGVETTPRAQRRRRMTA